MTKRQRKSKAKVKRARHKRARVVVDIETHGVEGGEGTIGVASFRRPPLGAVAEYPLPFAKRGDPDNNDLFAYSVFHPARVKPGVFVVGRVMTDEEARAQYNTAKAGTAAHKAIEKAIRTDQPGARLNASEQLAAYCLGAVKFDCSLYDVLHAYSHVVTGKKFNGKDRHQNKKRPKAPAR